MTHQDIEDDKECVSASNPDIVLGGHDHHLENTQFR